jgi:chromosomal replication initiation ATPase DnaA
MSAGGKHERVASDPGETAAVPVQLTLDLPHRAALAAEDFLVSGSNAAAVSAIDRWPDWPAAALVVSGPAGSGKSHLVNVWRTRTASVVTTGPEIDDLTVERLGAARALAVEDIDRGIGNETVLFHLLNLARERGVSLLLTSGRPPGELEVRLPDLRSRLRALAHAAIDRPDEPLLAALIVKLIADRQLAVEPHVVAYLARHMERSAEAARRVVVAVDRLALERQSKVTRALAIEALRQASAASD